MVVTGWCVESTSMSRLTWAIFVWNNSWHACESSYCYHDNNSSPTNKKIRLDIALLRSHLSNSCFNFVMFCVLSFISGRVFISYVSGCLVEFSSGATRALPSAYSITNSAAARSAWSLRAQFERIRTTTDRCWPRYPLWVYSLGFTVNFTLDSLPDVIYNSSHIWKWAFRTPCPVNILYETQDRIIF